MPRGARRHGPKPPPPAERPIELTVVEHIPAVKQRTARRHPCSVCHLIAADDTLIRGLDKVAGSFCEPCWNDMASTFANRLVAGETLNRYYQRTYGISTSEYGQMYLRQRGQCAICKIRPEANDPLAVDHDHATGAVRGLLCRTCNIGLGCFKDNVASMGRAIAYLSE